MTQKTDSGFLFYFNGGNMEDTIAAICTALGNGGVSIIRVSGDKAISIVNKVFKGKNLEKVDTHTINYGYIHDDGVLIDEVLVSVMKAPRTYTKEDVVEVNCHGGILVTKNVLKNILKNGARLAQAGEFTKRAFLNGRIDLSQAEAVMDLINSKNDMSVKNAMNQLNGYSQKKIKDIREEILNYIAFIEAALDDPEHYEIENYGNEIIDNLNDILSCIKKMIKDSENGRVIKEGIKTAIVGLPNAGKSSLMNYLAKKDRAIVTDVAGTTRDVIEETIVIDGILLNISDTAGIRETDDVVEKIGVDKSIKTITDAELILYVLDSSEELNEDNFKIFEKIKDKNVIIIFNKNDKSKSISINKIPKEFNKQVSISLLDEKGLDELSDIIKSSLHNTNLILDDEIYIANERQVELLKNAEESIKRVIESIENNVSEDFLTIDLTDAYAELGKILGEEIEEDIVNKIFKDFCMGK